MYNEYNATEGKVLLNVDSCVWGTKMLSKLDLLNQLISTTKEEAEYMSGRYQSALADIEQQYIDDPEGKATAIQEVANTLKQELLDKGYVLGKDIEVIIHE